MRLSLEQSRDLHLGRAGLHFHFFLVLKVQMVDLVVVLFFAVVGIEHGVLVAQETVFESLGEGFGHRVHFLEYFDSHRVLLQFATPISAHQIGIVVFLVQLLAIGLQVGILQLPAL